MNMDMDRERERGWSREGHLDLALGGTIKGVVAFSVRHEKEKGRFLLRVCASSFLLTANGVTGGFLNTLFRRILLEPVTVS